jgi:hypothetical protein
MTISVESRSPPVDMTHMLWAGSCQIYVLATGFPTRYPFERARYIEPSERVAFVTDLTGSSSSKTAVESQ